MELRTLANFVALAREGSVSAAALSEHISQPALSRQLAALETELGCTLYTRGKKGVKLTDDGMTLLNYAQKILATVDEAEERLARDRDAVRGNVRIGCGVTAAFDYVAQAARNVQESYPDVRFHFHSGTSVELLGDLSKGFYDFVLECEVQKHVELNIFDLPLHDTWGLTVRADSPLAQKARLVPEDLRGQRIIASRQALKSHILKEWAGDVFDTLQVTSTFGAADFNLNYLVKAGMGGLFTYREMTGDCMPPDLVTVPLCPPLQSHQALLWRKTIPSPAAQAFLDEVRRLVEEGSCTEG